MDSLTKLSFYTHSESEIKAVALTYQYRSDFQKDHPGVYTSLFNRGLTEVFFRHTQPKPRGRSLEVKQKQKEECEKLIATFATYEELQISNPELLSRARSLKITLPTKTRRLTNKIKAQSIKAAYRFNNQTLDEIISLCRSYRNRVDFHKDHPELYCFILANCLVTKVFDHVSYRYAIPDIKMKDAVSSEMNRLQQLADLQQIPRIVLESKDGKSIDELLTFAISLIPKYRSLTNFKISESVLVANLERNGLYKKFAKSWEDHHRLTDEQIIAIAKDYPSKTALKYAKTAEQYGTNIWYAVTTRGLEEKAFAHMENGYIQRWNSVIPKEVLAMSDKDIINDCLKFPNMILWRLQSPFVSRHAKKRKGLLAKCLKSSQDKHGERVQYENTTLHPKINRILKKLDIQFDHESKLLTGSRPDFTITIKGRVYIIEVKSDRVPPATLAVKAQLNRYHEQGKEKYGRKFGRVILVSDHRHHIDRLGSIKLKDIFKHLEKLAK